MATDPPPSLPRYGEASLAELAPSVVAALGLDAPNPLNLRSMRAAIILLVDGLGWHLLRKHPNEAPFLTSAAAHPETRQLTAPFPATTATSLGSFGTGLAPGEHGLVGYTFAVPTHARPMNALTWRLYGSGPVVDLRNEFRPEEAQPSVTWLQRVEAAGAGVVRLGPPELERTPLSRAALRGGRYVATHSLGDLAAIAPQTLTAGARFLLAYHGSLDTTGHVRGVESEAWALELSNVDTLAQRLAERLPAGAALIVTGDHGMIDLTEDERLDVSEVPALVDGVQSLGGEARARHVYVRSGAGEDVLATWRETLHDRMWACSRDEAIAEGWFGPRVSDAVRPRIGDVVAAAFGAVGIVQRVVDPSQSNNLGHHGSMTAAEQLVPALVIRK
jgi:Type I phosphodiesterase / nucleotide pyrophosphatase